MTLETIALVVHLAEPSNSYLSHILKRALSSQIYNLASSSSYKSGCLSFLPRDLPFSCVLDGGGDDFSKTGGVADDRVPQKI
ncbi:hypothetical protein RCL_jg18974.t1 [Rhizophagus clarus]|uniref:Uncharacterized protein n=1 Tax=Rhizophagus clarus TaxID=94130 RepID=A0A8H3LYM5_9GLOM|nr:hypothetical protein RCL_jg18974.t1 [Rhizophagus clarus]